MGGSVIHWPNGKAELEVVLDRDDIDLAKMYLAEDPDSWLNVVRQFRDGGRNFSEATSIVYLARRELGYVK